MSKQANRNQRRGGDKKPSKLEQRQQEASRASRGERLIADEQRLQREGYNLKWFKPVLAQPLIVQSMEERELTIVDSPSGTGKTSTILWKALSELENGYYSHIVLIKTPTEVGTDQIGFLPNSAEDKISVHMDAMKSIFFDFMSPGKLETDIKNGKIVLTIPNFILGKTLYNSLIILEECQTMNPETVKLLTERCGEGSRVVIAGDSKQRYSVKKREDGFRDLINRVTGDYQGHRESKFDNVGYIRMETNNNMRSSLSRFITEIYE